nr:putative reverse transcriptase domain-containing protein [Tanacetum cinerariifolium]
VCWTEAGEAQILGPELIQESTEKIVQIKERMQAARDRQKSYDDLKPVPLDGLHLDDKLHFMEEPVEIVDRKVKQLKQSRIPLVKDRINVKKCHADEPLAVPLEGLHFDDKLHFMEVPVEIVDCEVKRLKQSRIPLVKDEFRKKYPHLFARTASTSNVTS